jgi:hypothetical protein
MELRGIIEKHEPLEVQARDMIRDKLSAVLSRMNESEEIDALPTIIEPQPEIIEYVFS